MSALSKKQTETLTRCSRCRGRCPTSPVHRLWRASGAGGVSRTAEATCMSARLGFERLAGQ